VRFGRKRQFRAWTPQVATIEPERARQSQTVSRRFDDISGIEGSAALATAHRFKAEMDQAATDAMSPQNRRLA
jgi:hypothetical protein